MGAGAAISLCFKRGSVQLVDGVKHHPIYKLHKVGTSLPVPVDTMTGYLALTHTCICMSIPEMLCTPL